MPGVGESLLDARVLDDLVGLEAMQGQLEVDLAAEEANGQARAVRELGRVALELGSTRTRPGQ
jgi:hypothetical protein